MDETTTATAVPYDADQFIPTDPTGIQDDGMTNEEEDIQLVDPLTPVSPPKTINIDIIKYIFDIMATYRPKASIGVDDFDEMTYMDRVRFEYWLYMTMEMVTNLCEFNRLAVVNRELERAGIDDKLINYLGSTKEINKRYDLFSQCVGTSPINFITQYVNNK